MIDHKKSVAGPAKISKSIAPSVDSTVSLNGSKSVSDSPKPSAAVPQTNRFQKGRFSVLTVTESTSSPYQNVLKSEPVSLAAKPTEPSRPKPPPQIQRVPEQRERQQMCQSHESTILQSQPPHQTAQYPAPPDHCPRESSAAIPITIIPTSTNSGESGSTASGSYVTAFTSGEERCSSSSISPSSSAGSTTSGLDVVAKSELLG